MRAKPAPVIIVLSSVNYCWDTQETIVKQWIPLLEPSFEQQWDTMDIVAPQ
jgi:hypothetical protein